MNIKHTFIRSLFFNTHTKTLIPNYSQQTSWMSVFCAFLFILLRNRLYLPLFIFVTINNRTHYLISCLWFTIIVIVIIIISILRIIIHNFGCFGSCRRRYVTFSFLTWSDNQKEDCNDATTNQDQNYNQCN